VQSALESVKGVKRAKVSFDDREAVVTYDPDVVKLDDLIKAVKDAPGMSHFDANVKKSDTKDTPLLEASRLTGLGLSQLDAYELVSKKSI